LGLGDERRDRGVRVQAKFADRAHYTRKIAIVDTSCGPPLHPVRVGGGSLHFKPSRSVCDCVDDPAEAPVWCAVMRLRTGLVGLGKHGLRYAKHIHADVPGLQLAAVCRRDRRVGEAVALEYGCAFESDARALAARDDIDLIVIAAAPAVIEEVVAIAAPQRKRLLIEKPVAPDLRVGLRILGEIERSGVYCAAGQTLRLNTVTKEIARRVTDLGRLDSMIFSQRFPAQLDLAWLDDPTQSGGGNVLHTGVHCFDLCRVFSRAEPRAAFCTSRSVHTRRTEDLFASCIEMSDGSLATVSCSRTTHSRNGLIEITGEHGQLVGDHVLNTLYRLGPRGREDIPLPPPTHTVLELLRTIADDCRWDRPPTIPYREGLAAVAVAEACYRSIASGQKERVVMPPSGP
jgi:predicted dehydrogenase